MASPALLTAVIRLEQDVVFSRQRAREIAGLLGFDAPEQTAIATAVSEISRNAYQYAGGGRVEFRVDGLPQYLEIRVSDHGPGITDVSAILQGRYRSSTGMGLGIQGARRLMDSLVIEPAPRHGTVVTMRKKLARRALPLSVVELRSITERLAQQRPSDTLDELRLQSQELLLALGEIEERNEQLSRLNQELEDTNRGVVALYSELEEKAEHLRQADELKSRFLSNMGHEFRTPLNSILALSRILLDRMDGELSPEQERQVGFIRKAASDLTELVNDLLDLAKVEAGKTVIRPLEFDLARLLGSLRGMMRPLVHDAAAVAFVVEDPRPGISMYTDEARLSQILRNLASNAIKFTERGEVRVSTEIAGNDVVFHVRDTGIGIAPEDQDRIFSEFTQIDTPVQRRVKGTGLGLSLSKKLAELLGGSISVRSAVNEGSTFTLRVPARLDGRPAEDGAVSGAGAASAGAQPAGAPTVLVVDDNPAARYVVRRDLEGLGADLIEASGGAEALEIARQRRLDAVVLDLMMPDISGFDVLEQLKANEATRGVPVIVYTTRSNYSEAETRILAAAVEIVGKGENAAGVIRGAVRRAMRLVPE